jgi:hypothetical protein
MWTFRLVFLLIVIAVLSPNPAAGIDDERTPVPPTTDLVKAEALVKGIFKSEYAKTKRADRTALASKLLEQFAETKDDQAARYVLLREARDIAAKAGDAEVALKAASDMAAAFKVDAAEVRLAVVNPVIAGITTAASAALATEVFLAAVDDAKSADDLKLALAFAKAADAAAYKAKNVGLATQAKTRLKEIEVLNVESEKVKDHLETLKTKPDDPVANLAVGRFLWLVKQDWDMAASHFANVADEKLRDAAVKDAKAADGGDADKLAAGDAWYDLAAGKVDAPLKVAAQIRALHWYSTAVADLMGLNKAKVEKRIVELKGTLETRPDKGSRWAGIRKAVAEKDLKHWSIVGGVAGRDTFEEIPKEGGILIGFMYSTTGQGRYPCAVQPIFLTSSGEKKGKPYGVPDRGTVIKTVKAKPGYAVGAIYTRGGLGFDAFQPIFMKMTDKGLNTDDKYEGDYVGGKGGSDGTLGGDGNFIVGLHGKIDKKNGRMMAMSIVTLTSAESTSPPKKKRP